MNPETNFTLADPTDAFECARLDVTDELLSKSKIAAYMFNQTLQNSRGEEKPYNPKTFPGKAVDIMIPLSDSDILEIYLDDQSKSWNSKFKYNGKLCRLGPDQMNQFFKTNFYAKTIKALESRWPESDPFFGELLAAVRHAKMNTEFQLEFADELTEDNMPGKRVDLANKDITGDGKRDYSETGRKILTFGEMGVKGGSGEYYCWPNPKYPYKWSQWKDWHKIKPLCKMHFIYNNRTYMISLSPSDENVQNRGFRGADVDWDPPLGWLTPGECEQIMKLSIVHKFCKQCVKRIKHFISKSPEEIYENINNKEKISLEEIRETIRVIKLTVNTALNDQKADNYCFE